jgi:phage shock protein E
MLNQIKSFFQNLFSKAEVEQVIGNSGATDIASLVKNGAFLVDMRTESEFQQGHAPGSINVPLSKLGRNMSLFDGKKNIVVFCHSGNRSEYAKDVLVNKGLKNVYNGGAWADIQRIINE